MGVGLHVWQERSMFSQFFIRAKLNFWRQINLESVREGRLKSEPCAAEHYVVKSSWRSEFICTHETIATPTFLKTLTNLTQDENATKITTVTPNSHRIRCNVQNEPLHLIEDLISWSLCTGLPFPADLLNMGPIFSDPLIAFENLQISQISDYGWNEPLLFIAKCSFVQS